MARSGAPARRPVTAARVLAVGPTGTRERPDRLVTEEPLEIRVRGPVGDPVAVATTLRTPGHDFDLAIGFLHAEGVVRSTADVAEVAYCLTGAGVQEYNVVTVRLRGAVPSTLQPRAFPVVGGCGVCGRATLDDLEARCRPVGPGPTVAWSVLAALPARLAQHQEVFDRTGGLHAAARFRPSGELIGAREDVGRHNALDKLLGQAVLDDELPLRGDVLLVSGRLGYELVQKAAVAGVPIVCAVSAPSSLAVATAERFGMTVVGFLRDGRGNVYTGAERVDPAA